jgi:hypothetical protein
MGCVLVRTAKLWGRLFSQLINTAYTVLDIGRFVVVLVGSIVISVTEVRRLLAGSIGKQSGAKEST